MHAAIKAIEYYLPPKVLTNDELVEEFPEWTSEKILEKTGIRKRHAVEGKECASDLAYFAAQKLFASSTCKPTDIDFLLLCTQSPDYLLPTSACILQERLGLSMTCGALDFNLGCSGYVYGISLAKGLIESGQAQNVLLITSETYTKYLRSKDKSVRSIFGDAAAATLIIDVKSEKPYINQTRFGTDGKGAANLIVHGGAMREPDAAVDLQMNGPEIFTFALRVVPPLVEKLLHCSNCQISDIDLFVFHQANKYMLDHLRRKLLIPKEKFYIYMEEVGNTVSSSIPIALKHAVIENKLKSGDSVMLVGFGVGYSWAGMIAKML
ncbi:MAG: ketoacyl-ACP synthase III [Gammaproteobacteria bacterium]|nr:ketoacyl-ACP synthase III [Gammaproteobacteria bacterium]